MNLLRAPEKGHTPLSLRMQALTAVRFDDILAHVTFTGPGSKDRRLYPLCVVGSDSGIMAYTGPGGLATPEPGRRLRAPPNKPTAAS